jgi:hypothetical protein
MKFTRCLFPVSPIKAPAEPAAPGRWVRPVEGERRRRLGV